MEQLKNVLKELGYKEGTFAFKHLSFLIRSMTDFQKFVSEFYDRNKTQLEDVVQFRHWKIDQLNLSYEKFETLYQENKKKALETLFQEPMSERDVSLVANNINNKIYTLSQIFEVAKTKSTTISNIRYGLPKSDDYNVVDLAII
jgi:hypothetical protein